MNSPSTGQSSAGQPTPIASSSSQTSQPSAGVGTALTPVSSPSTGPVTTTTPFPSITLWVPPEFDPAGDSTASQLLADRLAEFSNQNNGVQVLVRVKASSGSGSLLESLNAANAAAPSVLPSVVALSRTDLEAAAIKGLVFPLDGVSNAIDQADWYDYSRQLAMVQGATFALPFAGDVLILAYRPEKVTSPPIDWQTIFRVEQPVAFAASDNQALFVLSMYQSLGGAVEDAQRRPTLQPEILTQVLKLLADGEQRGIFPNWLSQYETNTQVWQAYQDQKVDLIATWASNYLASQSLGLLAVPIPPVVSGSQTKAMATGWGWAVADPIPERRALSVRLAEFLSDGAFLAKWTEAAGYLPTRPSSLAAWSNQSLKTLLSPVAISAQARPSVDQLASLGPVLKEAILKVLKREAEPALAARAAAEKLQVPETK